MADYVIDMGPGAGVHGGQVVAAGTPEQIIASKASITGKYLTGDREISIPAERRRGEEGTSVRSRMPAATICVT